MSNDNKKGVPIPDTEKPEFSVYIAEPGNERYVVELEDDMTPEEQQRDQRIADRITGHHDGGASSKNLIRQPWMSDEDYRGFQREGPDTIKVAYAIDPDAIKSFEDLIPNREDWMSDDDYRSQIEMMFLVGAELGTPLTDEVWAHVGLSPQYDDPDYNFRKFPAPVDLNFVADLSEPDDLKTAEQWPSWTPVWSNGLSEQNFFELLKLSLQCYRLDNDMEPLSDDVATEWVLGRLKKSGVDLDLIDPTQEPEAYLKADETYIQLKAKLDAAMPSTPSF